jgi:hypothetical protein
MYYAEKIIDGVLHYQTTPDGKWTPYTTQQLSTMVKTAETDVMAKEKELIALRDEIYYLKEEQFTTNSRKVNTYERHTS